MAQSLAAKPPTAVYRYSWAAPVVEGDTLATVTAVATGVTLGSAEIQSGEWVFYLSGGTAGQTGSIAIEATTQQGETLVETLYVPIVESVAIQAKTVREVCEFALRKVTGMGETADADELADAMERLEAMLLLWKDSGGDVGATFPLADDTVLYLRDSFVSGVQYGLRLLVHQHYGVALDPLDLEMANRGLQRIKQANVPDVRAVGFY